MVRTHSETVKSRISNANKGKPHTEEFKKKLSIERMADKNPNWKGDKVGNNSLHQWINNHKIKPELCENCKLVPPHDLANISGKYLRDLKDWIYLCRKCHMVSDNRLKNLVSYKKNTRRDQNTGKYI